MNGSSSLLRFFGIQLCVAVGVQAGLFAQSHYDFCPLEKTDQPIPHVHLTVALDIPTEALRASLLFPRHEMEFLLKTSPGGKIDCITPVSGSFSLFTPAAERAIEQELAAGRLLPSPEPRLVVLADPRPLRKGHRRVIVVPDPLHPAADALIDPEIDALSCDGADVDALLEAIWQMHIYPTVDTYPRIVRCADAAVALSPGSFAIHYVAAEVDRLAVQYGKLDPATRVAMQHAEQEHIRTAIGLAPDFLEARDLLRADLFVQHEWRQEEKVALDLTALEIPPRLRANIWTDLSLVYDEENDRPRALLAARRALELSDIIHSLEAASEDELRYSTSGMLDREQLAAREEEAGEFHRAAADYRAAHDFAKPGLYYDGPLFKIDMGEARSLRSTGDSAGAAALCDKWTFKVAGPLRVLENLDHGNRAMEWGGIDVARATWEFSCRDFGKGVQALLQIAGERLDRPVDKWGDNSMHFYLKAPLEALESAFQSRELFSLAADSRGLRNAIPDDPSEAQFPTLRQAFAHLRERTVREMKP